MNQINQNSILLNYTTAIRKAASNPNNVVIAGGYSSVPTGEPFDYDSNQFEASPDSAAGFEAAQSRGADSPTKPGIQIFSGDHETNDGEECCCECCCTEPEPPLIFMRPEQDCPCPQARKQLIGVFIDGVVNALSFLHPDDQRVDDAASGMQFLCQRYGGEDWRTNGSESWLYRSVRMPGATEALAKMIADRLVERICRNYSWNSDRREWVLCNRIDIDLFGYSRGAATAILVARKLNEMFKCVDCLDSDPIGPFKIRFLGIIDPATGFLPDIVILPHEDIEGSNEVPPNVRYFYQAYTDADKTHDVVKYKEPGSPDSDLENALVIPDFHLSHRNMDDWNKGPISELEKYFNRLVADPPLAPSDKPSCRMES